jgi:hypothetical protein
LRLAVVSSLRHQRDCFPRSCGVRRTCSLPEALGWRSLVAAIRATTSLGATPPGARLVRSSSGARVSERCESSGNDRVGKGGQVGELASSRPTPYEIFPTPFASSNQGRDRIRPAPSSFRVRETPSPLNQKFWRRGPRDSGCASAAIELCRVARRWTWIPMSLDGLGSASRI